MNIKLVEKFFANQTTPGESKKVLEWLETTDGADYLKKRFQKDSQLLDRDDLRSLVPELESNNLFSSIEKEINNRRKILSLRRANWQGTVVKAAAAVLVILSASLFAISHHQFLENQIVEREPAIFQTQDEQHREITLRDSTVVRMNSNSEMIVSKDYDRGTREITLTGEAYFDVAHDPDQPFIVHANQSTVEVLGTAFNVRSVTGQDNVQVAVIEGVVSFKNKKINTEKNNHSVILSQGQYGYMDLAEGSITVDEIAINNYLTWKSGRFVFDGVALNQVCLQLSRLYDVSCGFEDANMKNLQLTANFSDHSLEKTLEVIALSLEIDFSIMGSKVNWTITSNN